MRGRHLRRFALYVRGIIRSRPVPAETRGGRGDIAGGVADRHRERAEGYRQEADGWRARL
jgi:hypothetical protein